MLSKEKARALAEKIRLIYQAEFNEDESPDDEVVVHIHNSHADQVPGGHVPVEVAVRQNGELLAEVGGFYGNKTLDECVNCPGVKATIGGLCEECADNM